MSNDKDIPLCFVFCWGKVSKPVKRLMMDVRRIMEPNTFPKLKITKKNVKKDILNVAGGLGVTHVISFTTTDTNSYMKIVRLPRGPTLTFKIQEYSCTKDVLSVIEHGITYSQTAFRNPPLIVMNRFLSDEPHVRLTQSMFQHLFPPVDLQNTKISRCRRVILLNRDETTDVIDFRHYYVSQKGFIVSSGANVAQSIFSPSNSSSSSSSSLMGKKPVPSKMVKNATISKLVNEIMNDQYDLAKNNDLITGYMKSVYDAHKTTKKEDEKKRKEKV